MKLTLLGAWMAMGRAAGWLVSQVVKSVIVILLSGWLAS